MTKAQTKAAKLNSAKRRMNGEAFVTDPANIGRNKYKQYKEGGGNGSSQYRIDKRRIDEAADEQTSQALKQAA